MDCFIGEAASLGAQLAVCPEAFIVGYPRGATSVIGSRSVKGREDYRKYLASAVNEPGQCYFAMFLTSDECPVYLHKLRSDYRNFANYYC